VCVKSRSGSAGTIASSKAGEKDADAPKARFANAADERQKFLDYVGVQDTSGGGFMHAARLCMRIQPDT
jgi:hypothetical protein